MSDYAPDLKRKLRDAGCEFVRHGKGDHDTWHSPVSGRYFTVDHKIKSRHTANQALKQAGLKKEF